MKWKKINLNSIFAKHVLDKNHNINYKINEDLEI